MIFVGIGAIGLVLVVVAIAFFAKGGRGRDLVDTDPLEDVPGYDDLAAEEDDR